jgi:hypothetical protein
MIPMKANFETFAVMGGEFNDERIGELSARIDIDGDLVLEENQFNLTNREKIEIYEKLLDFYAGEIGEKDLTFIA